MKLWRCKVLKFLCPSDSIWCSGQYYLANPIRMECLKKDDFARKLIAVVRKITECKKFDDTFIEKFFSNINQELCNWYDSILHFPDLSEWISEILLKWSNTYPHASEAIFVCKFIGIIAQFEQGFQLLQMTNALDDLSRILQPDVLDEKALKPVYISFLSHILNHTSGYEWINATKQWKVVSNLYFYNSNLYVEREGLNFLKKYINKVASDDKLCEKVLQDIFSPLKNYNETIIDDKHCLSFILLLLKLLQSILKMTIFSEECSFCVNLVKIFDLQTFLNFLLENCRQEIILDEASVLQVLFFVVQYGDKTALLSLGDIPADLDTFYALLKQNQYNGVIKLAKYCQVLWSEIRKQLQCESKTGVQFIIVQLLPALICIKPPDTALCDIYIQKVFSLTTVRAQKFCYLLRDEIRSKVGSKPKNLALKGILSVITNTECLNLEEAVIIFQAMAYMLKSFIPDNSCQVDSFNYYKCEKESSFSIQDTPLLSAVLNGLCVFVEKFKINWTESLESLCLLKMTCILLENTDIPSTVVVQVFLLVKLAILNFMSPDLALLLNSTTDSSLDCLMPILFKRLHDPNWEIRDSCLEIVTAIAELSESKYPAFQQLLIEKDLYSLVVDIMEGDSESYVRASAIQALSSITKIQTLNQFLFKIGFPFKVIKLLQNESEGIVRREAALVIKEIYMSLSDPHDEIVSSFYEVMGYLAVCDLHWEVKINALLFWEAVIQRIIADQGMIDGFFPKVTFSKEHKKIVTLTKDEVKLRLDKVLRKLSEVGCLYVLLSTLNDDCDMPVIKKSAQILSDLLNILKRHGVMETCGDFSICDRMPMKRKITGFDNCEKRKNQSSSKDNNSIVCDTTAGFINDKSACPDVVIDGIVNERDINLLVNVYSQKDKTVNLEKKILLQEVKLETFLMQMQDFELEKFLEDKQRWLINVEIDLKSLVSESYMANLIDETNVMDCY